MEADKQRILEANDTSDEGGEAQEEMVEPTLEIPKIRMLRSVLGSIFRPKPKLPTYDGILTAENLIDWINELDKYFDYEEIDEENKVKFVVSRIKRHETLWWESVQANKRSKNKPMIKSWDRMVAKMKGKFLPKDYHLTLYRQVQNLQKKAMTMREYTEEFYKVKLRVGYVEDIA